MIETSKPKPNRKLELPPGWIIENSKHREGRWHAVFKELKVKLADVKLWCKEKGRSGIGGRVRVRPSQNPQLQT